MLGCDAEFEGRLAFDGTIRVDGRFRGEISGRGTLIVGEKGTVEAEIKAAVVLVRGEVRGTIRAAERIEAYAPARIFGDLHCPVLVFGEGVIFQGASHMTVGDEKINSGPGPSAE